jgi:hypothetical protein
MMETLPDVYTHIRIVISIVLGLGIARLLTGLARFVQHPGKVKVYPIHLAWAFSILFFLVDFWWWELHLARLQQWNFGIYLFVIFYAVLFFLISTLLFPDQMEEYSGFEDYFLSRRRWFFGLLGGSFLLDLVDTRLKGAAYFQALGLEYPLRIACFVLLCGIAMATRNRRYHACFVAATLLYQLSWMLRQYLTP